MGYFESVLILGIIQAVSVIGLALFTGFTGQFSLGHASFIGIGAYVSAILTFNYNFNFYIALILGGLGATVASFVIGVPTLKAKLRSDYFVIAIMGFGEAVRVILENLSITQGARGIPGITQYSTLPVVIIVFLVSAWLMRSFVVSRFGWRAIAVREDPVVAEMMGINLFTTKQLSLAMSAFFCGMGGCLLAHFLMFIQPVMFTLVQSTQLVAAVVAGGIGSISGPAVMAIFFIALPELLRVANMWRLVFYGLILILIMVFRPSGLMGYRELIDVLRDALAWWKAFIIYINAFFKQGEK